MEKRYYTAASLEGALKAFEKGYGMESEDFYRAHVDGRPEAERVAGHHRVVWASFYRHWRRLTGDNAFAERIERELEPV